MKTIWYLIVCFEGNSNYVKSKCSSSTNKNAPKVTFSEAESCPRDRGYFGYCTIGALILIGKGLL